MKRLLTLLAGTLAFCLLAMAAPPGIGIAQGQSSNPDYDRHLALIRSQSVRNRNLDGRAEARLPQADLDVSPSSPQFGPRSDYLNVPNGNPSHSVPSINVGNFRVGCEFSHFAYDDPIVHPNRPGAAHLHMFFGNTDVNAYTTAETLKNSGSSTCNGQELNRTGYWAPAMIDGDGNARIPERIVVYYKGYGQAQGESKLYADGMANISPFPATVPEIPIADGGGLGTNEPQVNYKCSNNRSKNPTTPDQVGINEIPTCRGDDYARFYPEYRTVLEMDVKFWNCFDTAANVRDYRGWEAGSRDGWFGSNCAGDTYPNLEYFINYVVEPGEDTSKWYLASDVDPATIGGTPSLRGAAGSTHHADWWGAWHPTINEMWLDNCVNRDNRGVRAGCGNGYLSNGGSVLSPTNPPLDGPALKYREQFDKQIGDSRYYKVPVSQLFSELCSPLRPNHRFTTAASGAWCKPDDGPQGGPRCNSQLATIIGTPGDDVIRGTQGADVIVGAGGNDTIYALGGNDIVCGGPGNDRMFGSSGNDQVFGGNGDDQIWGGSGDDLVTGGQGADRVVGSQGDDRVTGGPGDDRLFGGDGNDYVAGDDDNDALFGGRGSDTCDGRAGVDRAPRGDCERLRNIG